MAGFKGLADKAKQYLKKNPDKSRQGIDRASKFVDEKTGGKYTEKIDKGAESAKGHLGGQGGSQERQPGAGEQGQQGRQGESGEGRQGERPPQ